VTLRATARDLGRSGMLTALALALALLCVAAAPADAAATPWSPVTLPWGASWAVNDIYAFGTTGLAAAGDGGHIGITRDGGRSWSVVVPRGFEATAFTAIAIGPSGRGVVASGGLLLVTDDGGSTWRTPSYIGPGPSAWRWPAAYSVSGRA
jgi:photosystem II stability/assembly factor-like uncharacterized protein